MIKLLATITGVDRIPHKYLFVLKEGKEKFENISLPLDISPEAGFKIEDIAFANGAIWLATPKGLFKQQDGSIEAVDLGSTYSDLFVRSVKAQPGTNELWIANPYGLIRYNYLTKDYALFNEHSGMPSNTINTRGIMFQDSASLWIGTSAGAAFSKTILNEKLQTPAPHILSMEVDKEIQSIATNTSIIIPPQSYIKISVASPTYPGQNVVYSYRLKPINKVWSDPDKSNLLTFSKLKYGSYELEIKARKMGQYQWSEVTTLPFKVERSFYETFAFKIIVAAIILLLVLSTWRLAVLFNKKRQLYLELVVKQRTYEIQLANEELASRNQELDQFVYSVSHDLSAPLKSLLGLINVGRHEMQSDSQLQLLEMMQSSVTKLERFIKDVIEYSRNARLGLRLEKVNLKSMVEEVFAQLSHVNAHNKIITTIDINEAVELNTDSIRMRIILNNLISNAMKFQDKNRTDAFVRVTYRKIGNEHEIKVIDNGIGIQEEFQSNIFNMFYRASDQSHGSGLGLYILKEAVLKLKGRIEMHSVYGEGSTFTVFLPEKEIKKEKSSIKIGSQ